MTDYNASDALFWFDKDHCRTSWEREQHEPH